MRVIVFGSNSATSLGLVRCLKNFEITLLCDSQFNAVKYSKYVSKKIFYDKLDAQLCDLLIKYKELHGSFIFPSSDENLSFILDHQSKLSGLFEITFSKFGSKILSKVFQKEYAHKSNLKVPRKIDVKSVHQTDLPVIIKPVDSLKYGKEYFSVIYNFTEYELFLKNRKSEIDFFAEEFIEGETINMFELIGYFDHKKNIYGYFGINKKRQFPPSIGSSSYIESFNFPNEIIDNLFLFFSNLEYVGLFDAEFKFCSKRKAYFFIECNFRAGAPISFTEINNFSLLNNYLKGISSSYNSTTKLHWMNDQIDYVNIKHRLSLLTFIKDILTVNKFAFFDKKDLKPFYKMLSHKFFKC
jgi:predicted ATP-grasp superfamily ATP-dependent carboligase